MRSLFLKYFANKKEDTRRRNPRFKCHTLNPASSADLHQRQYTHQPSTLISTATYLTSPPTKPIAKPSALSKTTNHNHNHNPTSQTQKPQQWLPRTQSPPTSANRSAPPGARRTRTRSRRASPSCRPRPARRCRSSAPRTRRRGAPPRRPRRRPARLRERTLGTGNNAPPGGGRVRGLHCGILGRERRVVGCFSGMVTD